MNIKPILNIDGLDIYEYIVYKLEKPFYDDYLKIDVISVHFTKETCDRVRVYFYGNPYKSHTYHPLYNSFADKIKIVGIDEENTFMYKRFLEKQIEKWQKERDGMNVVCDKARESLKNKFSF